MTVVSAGAPPAAPATAAGVLVVDLADGDAIDEAIDTLLRARRRLSEGSAVDGQSAGAGPSARADLLGEPVDRLGVGARYVRALARNGVETIGALADCHPGDLMEMRGVGARGTRSLAGALARHGLGLAGRDRRRAADTALQPLGLADYADRLARAGITTLGRLAARDEAELERLLPAHGVVAVRAAVARAGWERPEPEPAGFRLDSGRLSR